jgi:hypothetical protein
MKIGARRDVESTFDARQMLRTPSSALKRCPPSSDYLKQRITTR